MHTQLHTYIDGLGINVEQFDEAIPEVNCLKVRCIQVQHSYTHTHALTRTGMLIYILSTMLYRRSGNFPAFEIIIVCYIFAIDYYKRNQTMHRKQIFVLYIFDLTDTDEIF